ncbi:hypothetical protein HN695_04105 [Candidatus Woesearchaeota archaeon]|jgi:hypothetical protein|nr:hypothetical protein [Candidatus Woesearchaeota archaeon]MBT5272332.1 hypothetical protein [Candidatus Woesearchaeota archaeon]MBT6040661.1 hypothetical protein [Candidatus Woesearchaeota archaeon]MBT6336604.1 hypothetical protein [Candidatus Woesearchaeota archaeon]MBT7927494.1 hypothetical protein [Candidatus Woesearchaeota archaeon]
MEEEEINQEEKTNIFSGFGEDKEDNKNKNMKIIVSVVGAVVVLALFIYLISGLTGSNTATTLAIADLEDTEEAQLENQAVLEEIGIITADNDLETETGIESLNDLDDGFETDEFETTITTTTVSNYLQAVDKVLELRQATESRNTIEIAELVTDMNLYLEDLEETRTLLLPWQRLISCAYTGCDDTVFVAMIDAFATEDLNNKDHMTVHSVIETYNYWDGKNTVLFSGSLTTTNKLVLDNYNSEVISKWNEMIRCNGDCGEFNDMLFDLVGLIIN